MAGEVVIDNGGFHKPELMLTQIRRRLKVKRGAVYPCVAAAVVIV